MRSIWSGFQSRTRFLFASFVWASSLSPPCLGQALTGDSKNSLHSFTPAPITSPTSAATRRLKLDLHDVNILVVTDPHGWVAGHTDKDADFNFGDLLAFYETLRKKVVEVENKDLLLVLNGDFLHGNLLAEDPDRILEIMRELPWDAVTLGEHDLKNETHIIKYLEPGNMVDYWAESLVTSNILMGGIRGLLGNQFRKIVLPQSGKTLLVMSFLDPTLQHDIDSLIALDHINHTVNMLGSELVSDDVDGLLVMAHMGIQSPTLQPMLLELRAKVGDTMPIQIITGHTHTLDKQSLDTHAMAFEAGFNMKGMGFVRFDFDSSNMEGKFLETSDMDKLAETLGVEKFETSSGDQLKDSINSLVEGLGEDYYYEVLGCAPQSYSKTAPITDDNSLYRLWKEEIVPNFILYRLAESVESWNVLAHVRFDELFQNDLPEGRITRNDIASAMMHNEEIFRVFVRLAGDKIQSFATSFAAEETFLEESSPVSVYATPTKDPLVYAGQRYSLYTKESEVEQAHEKLANEKGVHPVTEATNINLREAFEEYVKWNWPCDGPKPTTPRPPNMKGYVPLDKIAKGAAGDPGKKFLVVLAVMCGVCLLVVGGLRYRRHIRSKEVPELRPSELAVMRSAPYTDDNMFRSEHGPQDGKGGRMRKLFRFRNKDDPASQSDSNLIDIVRNDSDEMI